jgi:bifunctional non-homologous end joining protein LigD
VKRELKVARREAVEPAPAAAEPKVGPVVPVETAFRRKSLSGNLRVKVDRQIVTLTHVDRVYWPVDGYTKADLLRYYWKAAATILPYLKDRPLILTRNPNGIAAPGFFQHDVDADELPEFVQTLTAEAENGRMIDYVICSNPATLLYLANIGTIAQNPWNSRARSLDNPDWIVFDLDPGEVDFRQVCDLALAVRDVLERLGLAAYAKTSGSRGMHLYVPLLPKYTYEQAAGFAARLAAQVVQGNPRLATLERSKRKRSKKLIYLDHLQNARGKTVASPYSVRARPGAMVSTPVTWAEVRRGVDPAKFTIVTLPARLAKTGDLFAPVLQKKQSLEIALHWLDVQA